MSEWGAEQPNGGGTPAPGRAPWQSTLAWTVGGLAAALAVIALLAAVIGTPGSTPSASGTGSATSTTTAPTTTVAHEDGAEEIVPTDVVAYLTADGRVLAGTGADTPIEIASGAALGPTGLGAVAVAPTGDLVAYVR